MLECEGVSQLEGDNQLHEKHLDEVLAQEKHLEGTSSDEECTSDDGCPVEAHDKESLGVLPLGFMPETPLERGLRDGCDVVVRWRVTVAQSGQVVPDALMSLDPTRYPTISRAKKAVRRGLVLKYRATQDPDAYHQSLPAKKRLAIVKTSTIVHDGEMLALQTQLGSGFYPHIPFDCPNFKLPVVYQVCMALFNAHAALSYVKCGA